MDTYFTSRVLGTVAAFLGVFLLYKWKTRHRYRLPPGPKGDFVFGHLLRTGQNRYRYYTQLSQSHGDIFHLKMFTRDLVIVNSFELIKEALGYDWLTGRVTASFSNEMTDQGHGLLYSQGDLWRDHRRFSLSVLKDFGLGRKQIEATIRDELEYLRKMILAENGRPFAPHRAFVKAVSNVICSVVFSERCSEDPEFETLIEMIQELTARGAHSLFYYILWPLLRHLPGDFSRLKRMKYIRDRVHDYVGLKYQQHKQTYDPSNIRDYIDAFLEQMNTGAVSFTEIQLRQAIFDLFMAGTETTSTTLLWAVIFLAQNPEVQRKVYAEINQTIGDKFPESSDRQKMRYTDAVILEVQRYATLVPLAPHRAVETGQLSGYDIPVNTLVIPNFWRVHRDSRLWKDPLNFNPENFLDDNGNVINGNYLLAFSCGKRLCLGENLARQELFIFFTGLIQAFEFVEDPNDPLPGVEDCVCNSLVRAPRHFQISARKRV